MENVSITIEAESIYNATIAKLTFTAKARFQINLEAEIVGVKVGRQVSDTHIQSIQKDFTEIIEVECIGLFREKEITDKNGIVLNYYGMRLFPFVSSILNLKVTCDTPVDYIQVDMPEDYRARINDGSIITNGETRLFRIRHSRGNDRSKYLIKWTDNGRNDAELSTSILFKINGSIIYKMIIFPIYYWIFALPIIAYTIYKFNLDLFLGTLTAMTLFYFQQLSTSNMPQKTTMLRLLYSTLILIMIT